MQVCFKLRISWIITTNQVVFKSAVVSNLGRCVTQISLLRQITGRYRKGERNDDCNCLHTTYNRFAAKVHADVEKFRDLVVWPRVHAGA